MVIDQHICELVTDMQRTFRCEQIFTFDLD